MVNLNSPENHEDSFKNNIADSVNEYYDMKDSIDDSSYHNQTQEHKDQFSNDKSPYFGKMRVESDKVRFISPIQKPDNNFQEETPKLNRSILNELLPTQMEGSLIQTGESDGRFFSNLNDRLAGWIFKGCFLAWTIISFYLIATASSSSVPGKDNLAQITGWFGALIIIGLGLSALWAKLLAEQTETVVYGLMLMVPGGFLMLSLYALGHFYIVTGSVFLLLSALVSAVIYFNRENLKTTVEIVRNAAIFLQANPQVYSFTFKVIVVYVAFLYVWLKAFLALHQGVFSLPLQISFIFMLLWVSGVLGIAQKFLIATWVRNWMDATDDAASVEVEAKSRLMNEDAFGTICLAAAILSVAKIVRIAARSNQLMIKSMSTFIPFTGIIADFSSWLSTMFSTAEKLMERFTDFTVYFLAVSGDEEKRGFVEYCRSLTRTINGHIHLAVTTDATAQILLVFSTVLISFASTCIIYYFAHGKLTWISSVLIGLLAASITGFISTIYTASIDACFLCYVLDLKRAERAGKIDQNIQNAFESKLTPSV